MVLFPGHDEYSESAEREGCGEVRDVAVAPEARRLGVATAMISVLEAATRERGIPRIGLSVALAEDDAAARGLYAKLGYTVAHGPFITSTDLDADDGRLIPVGAVMCYLTKSLRSNGAVPSHRGRDARVRSAARSRSAHSAAVSVRT